jgi:hypothetical protein
MQLLMLCEFLWTSLLLCVKEGEAEVGRLKLSMVALLRRRTTAQNEDYSTTGNGEGVRSTRNHQELLSEEEGHHTAHRRWQIERRGGGDIVHPKIGKMGFQQGRSGREARRSVRASIFVVGGKFGVA